MIAVDHASLQLEVRMAYRDKGDKEDDWKLLVQSNVTRKLECTIEEEKVKLNECRYESPVISRRALEMTITAM